MSVLIAEDDAVCRRMLEALLVRWGYEVWAAPDGNEALEMLRKENPPSVVILDWMMPGLDGIEICRELRRRAREPYTYILLLTSKGQKQDIVAGLDAGADDYLTKPFDPHELRARLRAGSRIVELQEQLIAAREALRDQATHDALTGLWNRGAIFEILQRELLRAQRQNAPPALIMADLDHFKLINDTYGHLAGDAVLVEVARRLKACIRVYDTLGRYGGEEFLLILPGCDVNGALNSAERLRNQVSSSPVDTAEGMIPITLSAGVAIHRNAGNSDATNLLRAADEALYRAKQKGRDRIELSTGFSALLSSLDESEKT